ncbi:hypothetical protein Ccar_09165 [Clostridium carboxidivorans P7]|uniref:Uncharacterized protein n=1 Tax=Clostridium carboxidivorans P7 TaxID=536227 RepID=C6PRS5_9CLOT|nr:hypothetical protein [Clostridium carboxidivorans]AKN31008.1 hypothetical protein Ccar_09165 [Clostridium carboxidivorans P7]EET88118.1 conserved hypothetical protein [Clostridium carboxidivorans P7]EFG88733.1 hypothetical protein CLCAR_1478 [Clostridium carboxidivorans P7]
MSDKKILSTGVLGKDINVAFAGITLVNLDPDDIRKVIVHVYRWDSGSSTPLPLSAPNPIVLNPNTSVRITANLQNAFFYEIRIIHPGDKDVLVNCYGVSNFPFVNGEGDTVLQHDLVEVKLK